MYKTSGSGKHLRCRACLAIARIHFVRASEASPISKSHNLGSVKKTCEASF